MCVEKKDIEEMLEAGLAAIRKEWKKDLLALKRDIRKDLSYIKKQTTQTNGSVGKHEIRIRDLEEYDRSYFSSREVSCPFKQDISDFKDALVTESALKTYMQERESKSSKSMRNTIALVALLFSVLVFLINYFTG